MRISLLHALYKCVFMVDNINIKNHKNHEKKNNRKLRKCGREKEERILNLEMTKRNRNS